MNSPFVAILMGSDSDLPIMKAGCAVFIAGAGMAAHLAGAVAAQTLRPVIGVPVATVAIAG
jgi:5-(carboxyamino)imidazole ribonucleotide mutase